ncbi:imidazoleglycerol phosphate synthase glutamine amidotransferase subunit HisH [Bradyrhizobium sp. CIR48]|nr:imidazoleglycerol phosphate synthase glutamine amidotransferase subunit HisH [Bradyrhizobium sp. CIR48]
MDIDLAVDAMELAEHIDEMVLFSGDGDFGSLVEAVQRRGVRVTVVSTLSSQQPMIADELGRQADVFTDLAELAVEGRPRSVGTTDAARTRAASQCRASPAARQWFQGHGFERLNAIQTTSYAVAPVCG